MGPAGVITLLVLAGGTALARAVLATRWTPVSWLEATAWAPALGFGLLSLIYFGWRFSGVPGASQGSLIALVLLATVGSVVVRPQIERTDGNEAGRSLITSRFFRWGSWVILGITVAGLLLAFHRWSTQWPLGTADAINIWNVRARFLLFSREDIAELLHMVDGGHPDYPLLLPGSLAAQAGFWGGWEQALPQATGAAFVLGLGLMTYLGLRYLGSHQMAAVATALVLASPPVWQWAFAQGADLPLAYLTLAAGLGLASHLQSPTHRSAPPVLAGFALGLLPWTKNDGVVLAASLGALFALIWLLQPRASRADWPTLLAIAVGALPGFLAVALFKIFWAPPGAAGLFLGESSAGKLLDSERWTTVLSTAGTVVDPFATSSPWRWIAVVLVVAIVLLRTRGAMKIAFLVFLPGSLTFAALGYILVYVLSPYPLDWHVAKSLDRLLLQLFPLAIVWALALARPSGEGALTRPFPLAHSKIPAAKDRQPR